MSAQVEEQLYVVCPECGRTSHHPEDVANDYCGACHAFNGGMENWLEVALERRLAEFGPHLQFAPDRCPSCASFVVLGTRIGEDGMELWWCASWSCRRTGLAAGRPKAIVREVSGFYSDVD